MAHLPRLFSIGALSSLKAKSSHSTASHNNRVSLKHAPYQIIDSFVREAYAEHTVQMKDGSESVLLGCLAVYHLEDLKRLVVAQDELLLD